MITPTKETTDIIITTIGALIVEANS